MKITHLIVHKKSKTIHGAIGWEDEIVLRFNPPIHSGDELCKTFQRYAINTKDFETVRESFEKFNLDVIDNNGILEEMIEQ